MSVSYYLNQFRPLAQTPNGRAAIDKHHLSPFIDASCRREPDLESEFPSISALCRAGHFAPRLKKGDIVAYITRELVFPMRSPRARRLVAVLVVHQSWRTDEKIGGTKAHELAAQWYENGKLPLPSNCMVPSNRPVPLTKTDRYKCTVGEWDEIYLRRAQNHGVFHACEKIFCDVDNPPKLTNSQLEDWFGRVPGTQNPPALPVQDFAKLLRWLVSVRPTQPDGGRLEDLAESL